MESLGSLFSKKSRADRITLSRGDTTQRDVESGEAVSPRESTLTFSSWWGGGKEDGESDWLPSLGKKERLFGFLVCLGLGVTFFVLAALLLPLIVLKARRFALLFTLGSLCTLGSFSFLWGPWSHLTHILSLQRLPFTLSYLGTLGLTLWAAVGLHSTPLTLLFGVLQLLALLWYLCSYVPGGTSGLWFMTKICSRGVTSAVND